MKRPELFLEGVAQRIKELRNKNGWTQEMLAEKSNTSPQFISYAESGTRAMRPENLLGLSRALGVSADYLLTGEAIDEDLLILSHKLRNLSPSQLKSIECIVDECLSLYGIE